MKTKITFLLISMAIACIDLEAQDLSKREQLDILSAQKRIEENADLLEAIEVANRLNMSLYGINKLDERGLPVHYESTNNDAATTTGTDDLRTVQNVDGDGMTIGVWECCNDSIVDGNIALTIHQDLIGRVSVQDSAIPVSYHATHVTGTLIGAPPSGGSQASKGMAYKANADAYGILNDASEMMAAGATTIDEVANGKLLISNHSYGAIVGWRHIPETMPRQYEWRGGSSPYNQNGVASAFGQYDGGWDIIARNAEYYLICKSAGNDRGSVPGVGEMVQNFGSSTFAPYNPAIHPGQDGGTTGYDCIPPKGNSKNILTVGAVTKSMTMSTFSSWGPTNDGRIKPDICGVGVNVTSASNASTTAYGSSNGTSMASPQVAGSLLLLQELYSDKYTVGSETSYMRATTLKALAINSATDGGIFGPDYAYGFGVLNAEKAGEFIVDDAKLDYTGTAVIIEDQLDDASDVFEFEFDILESADMRVTLVYHDVAADTLVNDLDLRVIQLSTNGQIQPWKLDPANPANVAVRGDNDIDNVEQVSQDNLAVGTYRAEVSLEGPLFMNDPQKFSLVISGIAPGCKASIQHKLLDITNGVYTAKDLIRSQGKIMPGAQVTYQTTGRVVLKPGFHAKAQTATGVGFFRTTDGTCN